MYSDWNTNAIVMTATLAAVCACVLLHYEGLSLLSRSMAKATQLGRRRVLLIVLGLLLLHTVEIWMFGFTAWLLLHLADAGTIAGSRELQHMFDLVYLSATTYTTVGFGDLAPVGAIRLLYGTEALAGFVLITWSASFTFLEMDRFWRGR